MNWLTEQQDDQENLTETNLPIEKIKPENWRSLAVSALRKLVDAQLKKAQESKANLELPDDEQVRACLDQHQLSEVSELLLMDDKWRGISLTGTLLAETAGAIFCNRPSLLRWQILGQLMEDDPIARRVIIDLVERRIEKRPVLRDEIRKIARKIVRNSTQSPTEFVNERDLSAFKNMLALWQTKPDLTKIWFGLRELGYLMYSRDDLWIFDLLFKTDLTFAVELIEEYGDPFRPYAILECSTSAPYRYFDVWKRLLEKALPAFETDGSWNGRVLEPLLLYIAQNTLKWSIQERRLDNEEQYKQRDVELSDLTEIIATSVWARSDGAQVTLRWGGRLFRDVMSALHSEHAAVPTDPKSGARLAWLIIESLFRSKESTAWVEISPPDGPPDDEPFLQALRLLAAEEHGCALPHRDFLLKMLPESHEEYMEGEQAKRLRDLPDLFTVWNARPDVLGMRVLALELIDEDVVARFKALWRRTLTLREMAEHDPSFQMGKRDYEDYGRKASDAIYFILSIGINVIDHLQDFDRNITSLDRREATKNLFEIMYDATREMMAIGRLGRDKLENIHNHLCLRRVLYNESYVGTVKFKAPLATNDKPTLGELLYERREVGRQFFDCLQFLLINHTSAEQIERELSEVGLSLEEIVIEADHLNAIEEKRKVNLAGLEHYLMKRQNHIN